MVLSVPDAVFHLLQFIALALPAIAIYLQVLVSTYQTSDNIEIDGDVPKAMGPGPIRERERKSEDDPNVIEALPALISKAHTHPDFFMALLSLLAFLIAGLGMTARLLINNSSLIDLSTILVMIGLTLFGLAILLTSTNSLKSIRNS